VRTTGATSLLAVLLLPLGLSMGGCAAGSGSSPAAALTVSPAVTSSAPSSSEATVSATSEPSPTPPRPVSTPGPTCVPGPITIVKGSVPEPVCLAVGSRLHLTSEASARQPWSAVQSSDPGVLSCQSTTHADGSVTATCHSVSPGSATLTTTTAPFAGDRYGPPQFRWQLAVTVTP
jgi:hypothetical protein